MSHYDPEWRVYSSNREKNRPQIRFDVTNTIIVLNGEHPTRHFQEARKVRKKSMRYFWGVKYFVKFIGFWHKVIVKTSEMFFVGVGGWWGWGWCGLWCWCGRKPFKWRRWVTEGGGVDDVWPGTCLKNASCQGCDQIRENKRRKMSKELLKENFNFA